MKLYFIYYFYLIYIYLTFIYLNYQEKLSEENYALKIKNNELLEKNM